MYMQTSHSLFLRALVKAPTVLVSYQNEVLLSVVHLFTVSQINIFSMDDEATESLIIYQIHVAVA